MSLSGNILRTYFDVIGGRQNFRSLGIQKGGGDSDLVYRTEVLKTCLTLFTAYKGLLLPSQI